MQKISTEDNTKDMCPKDPYMFNTETLLNEYTKQRNLQINFPGSVLIEKLATPTFTIAYLTFLNSVLLGTQLYFDKIKINGFLSLFELYCKNIPYSLMIAFFSLCIYNVLRGYDDYRESEKIKKYLELTQRTDIGYDVAKFLEENEELNIYNVNEFSLGEISRINKALLNAEERTLKLTRK